MPPRPAEEPAAARRADLVAGVLVAASLAFHLAVVLAGRLDLAPDEALYWDWARHLAFGYTEKPPMVAWLIALTRGLLGDSEAGVRLAAPLLNVVLVASTWALARRLFGSVEALLSLALLLALPLVHAGGLIMTIDAPLTAAWAAFLLVLWHARERGGAAWWAAAGALLGAALLSKYTAGILVAGMAAEIALAPRERRPKASGPLLLLAVAAAMLVPTMLWNAHHGWISFAHVAEQGHIAERRTFSLMRLGQFLGGQLLVVSPLLLGLLVASLVAGWRAARRGDRRQAFLLCFSLPTLVLYLLVSLRVKALENWPGAGWIAACIGAGPFARELWRRRRGRAFVLATMLLGVGLVALGVGSSVLYRIVPEAERIDPAARLHGWRDLGGAVSQTVAEHPEACRLAGSSEQVTAELAFYVAGHPEVRCLDVGRRVNDYDLWHAGEDLASCPLLVVAESNKARSAQAQFAASTVLSTHEALREGRPLRENVLFVGEGFKGTPKALP